MSRENEWHLKIFLYNVHFWSIFDFEFFYLLFHKRAAATQQQDLANLLDGATDMQIDPVSSGEKETVPSLLL